ncbi:MAG: response regulator [Desulfobacterales bacterium]|jgi:DNA-binding response OmpR family regulator
MDRVHIITSRPKAFQKLARHLTGCRIEWMETGQAALDGAERSPPRLAVVDESLSDMSGLALVRRLVQRNPWIHAAVATGLSEERFHEASEGLGISARLPLEPDESDAVRLMALLETVDTPYRNNT